MAGLSLITFLAPWAGHGPGLLKAFLFFLTVAGLPSALLHGALAALVAQLGSSGARLLGLLVLAEAAVLALAPLVRSLGDCQSLAALGIDNIDHRFHCAHIADGLANGLQVAAFFAGLASFGWPWLALAALLRR